MKDTIIIHCSATRAGQDITAADIDCWHRARGFWSIGYHYVIRLDGTIEPGRDVTLDGAHCMGWNQRSIGICYVGGLDKEGRPADTRTDAQRTALIRLVKSLQLAFPNVKQVIGSDEKQAVLRFLRSLPLKSFTVLVCDFANWAETAPLPCLILKK